MSANRHVDPRDTLPPPVIMRTAATPMPTPKSSLGLESESRRGSGISIDPNAFDQKSMSFCLRLRRTLEAYKPKWCKDHEDWSLYLFSPQTKFRMICQRLISHKMFDHVVLVFIFLNCITIALERPTIQPPVSLL
ncbi:voltage-dependent T-type calcium channel subunit alpha-1H-like [Megalobrama amblycephala]|uniref:voltage-dependent T-type calcium channel subunit alpha-1H-like n=1 Tax=Megalobrama amblycephala TaxID=75352 RepID=UPI002014653A|nr:voltage-dependent T-type calcium channel subunit alpha-1H-like [Megalobrama amblycephala]